MVLIIKRKFKNLFKQFFLIVATKKIMHLKEKQKPYLFLKEFRNSYWNFIFMMNLFQRRRFLVLRVTIVLFFFITEKVSPFKVIKLSNNEILFWQELFFFDLSGLWHVVNGLFFAFSWDMLETGWWRGKDGVGGFSYFKKGVTKQCFQEGETKLTLTTFFVLDLLVYIINFSYIVMTTRRNEGVKHEQIYRNDQFTRSTWIH